ncbi:MAG: acyl-CoA thioesterase [Alphaproteobacteria bacterium]|nr:acyl-CoA thioesterase [Alphaproteobacteria bacterium]
MIPKDVQTFLEKGTTLEGKIQNKIHTFPIRVAYKDTDAGGVVYHANYITWAERARVGLWFLLQGLDDSEEQIKQRNILESDGIWVARAVQADYLSPAKLYDIVTLNTQITQVGNTSMRFTHTVKRADETLAIVHVTLVWLKRETFKPARIPEYWRDRLEFILAD